MYSQMNKPYQLAKNNRKYSDFTFIQINLGVLQISLDERK